MRSATTMRARRYAPLGRCMYCLATGVKLSEEHLIPRSLNGKLTLRDAVCEPCRVLTGRHERIALETILMVPRVLLALRRRRARQAGPRRLPPLAASSAQAADVGAGARDAVPATAVLTSATWPRGFQLPAFEPAGLLAGVDRSGTVPPPRWASGVLRAGTAADGAAAARPGADVLPFGHALVKWAYSFAVAERALAHCDTAAVRQLLLGGRIDVLNFVGGPAAPASAREASDVLHALVLVERDGWLTARVHLLASAGLAPYEVVLGRVVP